MILAFDTAEERAAELRLLEEATRQELTMTKQEIESLHRIADELEMAVAEMVQERILKNGRAA